MLKDKTLKKIVFILLISICLCALTFGSILSVREALVNNYLGMDSALTQSSAQQISGKPSASSQAQTLSVELPYTADFSNGLPDNWSVLSASETALTSCEKTAGGLKLKHSDSPTQKGGIERSYFGGVYNINVGNLTDFEFNMTFKINDYANLSRFIGVLYHTQTNSDGMLEGYMMSYRMLGKSEQVTVTNQPSFSFNKVVLRGKTSADVNENLSKHALSDGQEHTIKITMVNGQATHYIDGITILTYNISDYSKIMNGNIAEGGFALLINKCEMEISSLTISGTKGNDNAKRLVFDNTTASVYSSDSKLINAPSVITEVKSVNDLVGLKKLVRAQTAILNVDENMNVLDKDGAGLGSFEFIYVNFLQGNVIPAIYLRNMDCANAFMNYMKTEREIIDIAVISDDADIVKTIRQAFPKIRGMVDWSGQNVANQSDYANVVKETNKALASVAILSQENATYDAVDYIQARTKTVWTKSNATTLTQVASLVESGTYGIISDNPTSVYRAYKQYDGYENAISRMGYNIAHRGLQFDYAENSIEGFIAAYENGATHFETDLKYTSDGEFVIMHDDTLNRTTNYTGTAKVEDMTLDEIQQYRITKTENNGLVDAQGKLLPEGQEANASSVAIPDISDVFEFVKDRDIVFACEVKSFGDVDAIVAKLKAEIIEHGVEDKIYILTGNTNGIIEAFRDGLPEIPVTRLMSQAISENNTLLDVVSNLAQISAGINSPSSVATPIIEDLKARGYLAYLWTFNYQTDINNAILSGTVGITNNSPQHIGHYARRLVVDQTITKADLTNTEFNAKFINFKGESAVKAKIAFRVDYDTYSEIVLCAEFNDITTDFKYTLFTSAIKVDN